MHMTMNVHLHDGDRIEARTAEGTETSWVDLKGEGQNVGLFASSAALRQLAAACVELADLQDARMVPA